MKPLSVALSSTFTTVGASGQPLDLKGSDGRLEVLLPPGSLDLSHASISGGTAPSGALTLQISQMHSLMIGQMNQLGSYNLQVVDSKGHAVNGIVLRPPATFLFHYQPAQLQAMDLNANHLVMTWPSLIQAALAAKQPTTSLTIPLSNDPKTHTLSGQSKVLGPGVFGQVSTPQVQSPPPTLLASVAGNTGQLSYSYPLQVPPSADGFAPQLSLVYSSMDPNSRPSRTSPSPRISCSSCSSIPASSSSGSGWSGEDSWRQREIRGCWHWNNLVLMLTRCPLSPGKKPDSLLSMAFSEPNAIPIHPSLSCPAPVISCAGHGSGAVISGCCSSHDPPSLKRSTTARCRLCSR
jgi:hypothetical protein